jgi:hypothetical protein
VKGQPAKALLRKKIDRRRRRNFHLLKQPLFLTGQYYLFLEPAEGYVKALEKSTSRVLNWREVFEHCAQND